MVNTVPIYRDSKILLQAHIWVGLEIVSLQLHIKNATSYEKNKNIWFNGGYVQISGLCWPLFTVPTPKKEVKKKIQRARYGTWTHDPQIKSLMLYRLS